MQVTRDILLVYGVLAAAVLLWATERLRMDLVAVLVLLTLTVSGILTPEEALAGFSDPVVVMIAALFVVGEGLFQTGVAQAIGALPDRWAGKSEVRLMVILMLMVAGLSAFMSSTGTVAVMVPVVMGLAWSRGISPSKLLLPVAAASLLGGTLTLIGTPPNLVVARHLEAMGREPFGLLSFTPLGGAMVAVGIAYMASVGHRWLPARPSPGRPLQPQDLPSLEDLAGSWELPPHLFMIRIPEGSPLAGKTLAELAFPEALGLTVLEVREEPAVGEGGRHPWRNWPWNRPHSPELPRGDTLLREGQGLLVAGSADGVARLVGRGHARLVAQGSEGGAGGHETGMAEVLLTPRSRLLGRTLKEIRFRDRYGLSVVGIKRMGDPVGGDFRNLPLRFGDMLLVQGPWDKIRLLKGEERDFVVAMTPREMEPALRPLGKAPLAVAILLAMLVGMTLGVLPAAVLTLMAAAAMVVAGCVAPQEAYRSVNWESLVLIAGVLPLATALEKTGGMEALVQTLAVVLEGAPPRALLLVLFLVTSLLSQIMSNTATAVLLAPIAFRLAAGLGAAPEPFLMTIALAASTAFSTPVASPVNMLVLGPGGYRFRDFLKVGVPLQLLMLVVVTALVPLLFPF